MIPAVNLIPIHRLAIRRRQRRARRWTVACGVYGLTLSCFWFFGHALFGGADRVIAADLAHAQTQVTDTSAAIEQIRPRLSDARATLAASRSIGNRPDWSMLMALLAELLDDKTVLSACSLYPEGRRSDTKPVESYGLRIGGLARTHAAMSAFVLRLEETELFDRVKLRDTRREPFGTGQAIAFRIECAIGHSHRQEDAQ